MEIGEAQGRAAGVHARFGHEPGGGTGQAEIVLHPFCRGTDLEARRRIGAHRAGQRALHGGAFGLGARGERGRQRRRSTPPARRAASKASGGRIGIEAAHARLVSS